MGTDRSTGRMSAPATAWRLLLFSVAGAVVLFAFVELLLLVIGVSTVHDREDPFHGFSGHVSVFERDAARGVYTSDREATRETFNAQEFRIQKPPDEYRVFCIGGSSAYGFPWGAEVAFPAVLRDLLAAADPDLAVEVVNAAGVSYASHRLRILTRELLRYEPDLLIVYSGHNEFIEKSFYRSLRTRARLAGPLDRLLPRSRIYAVVRMLIDRRGDRRSVRGELELLVRRDRGEPVDPGERRELVAFFAENLRAICRMASENGTRVILCTAPANLRDWRPERATARPALESGQQARWREALDAAEAALAGSHYGEALDHVEVALALAPDDGPSHFLAGRCHEGLGEWTEARSAYARACAFDDALLRATDAINDATRSVAAEANALLVDVERRFETLSPHGLVGFDLIDDYVHPTRRGHEEIAGSIWRAMRDSSLPAPPRAMDMDALAAEVFGARRDRVSASENTQTFLYNQGLVLANQGRWRDAIEKLDESVALAPTSAEVHFHAGRAREELGDIDIALGHYASAGAIDPAFTEARYNLGVLLANRGRMEEAGDQFEAVVELDPSHADALNNLAVVRTRQGRLDEAFGHLESALLAQPGHLSARRNLERLRDARARQSGPPRSPDP